MPQNLVSRTCRKVQRGWGKAVAGALGRDQRGWTMTV